MQSNSGVYIIHVNACGKVTGMVKNYEKVSPLTQCKVTL